ncbi:MAG: helix-turn-helix domain-containing protein [Bacteroidetes bacterium]|jgi:transcriptional regulator with XRE-family HTH domain|nr:helix-turn-helix domain-containing protein [Bacteroidota bacterium]
MIDRGKLAGAVRAKRGERTLRDAAEDAGLNFATLSRIENENPCDLDTFARICDWLGVPMDYFRQAMKEAA